MDGRDLAPKADEYIPTIKHRPVDLDPQAFLKGKTRTSTTIGGKAAKKADKATTKSKP